MLPVYYTVRAQARAEIEIKKSLFVATVSPATTEESALAFVEELRREHRKANHNVYACVIGLDGAIVRFSDDGEPAGTAAASLLHPRSRAPSLAYQAVLRTKSSMQPPSELISTQVISLLFRSKASVDSRFRQVPCLNGFSLLRVRRFSSSEVSSGWSQRQCGAVGAAWSTTVQGVRLFVLVYGCFDANLRVWEKAHR